MVEGDITRGNITWEDGGTLHVATLRGRMVEHYTWQHYVGGWWNITRGNITWEDGGTLHVATLRGRMVEHYTWELYEDLFIMILL